MAGAGSPRALGTAFGSRTGRSAGAEIKGGPDMVIAEPAYMTAAPETAERRGTERRRGVAALLSAVTTGLSVAREPGPLRERFEDELRALVRARSISVRDEPQPAAPNVTCIDIPPGAAHHRARIEAIFEPARMLEGGAQIAALLLEMERVQGRPSLAVRSKADGAAPLIGSSAAIRAVRERIERVAATDFTVLIEGESGTGKELVAHQIHELSRRRRGPFVAVNCAAIVETLIEAELFGIEERTATGVRGQIGRASCRGRE